MPHFKPLGDDPALKENQIPDKEQCTVNEIKGVTTGASLGDINKKLNGPESPWYKAFDIAQVRAKGCMLYAMEEVYNYNQKLQETTPDAPAAIALNTLLAEMVAIQKMPDGTIVGKIEKAAATLVLMAHINEWIAMEPKTVDDVPLCKSFLILSKTLFFRVDTLSFAEKMLAAAMKVDLGSLKEKLIKITETASRVIIQASPTDAPKTIEAQLDERLPQNPIGEVNKEKRDQQFQEINLQFMEQGADFEQLEALKNMQRLFVKNQEKVTGREYFSSLIGVQPDDPSLGSEMEKRAQWFEMIIENCDDVDKAYWREEHSAIMNPTPEDKFEQESLSMASAVTAIPTVVGRMLWNAPLFQNVIKTDFVQNTAQLLSEQLVTRDSRRKTEFMELVGCRIDTLCEKIADKKEASNENTLADDLKDTLTTPEAIKELEIKAILLGQLFEQDKKLADFIEKNNTRSVKIGRFISSHLLPATLKGPIGTLVKEAKGYRTEIMKLKGEVAAGKNLEERINTLHKSIGALDERAREIKSSFSKRLAGMKSTEKSTNLNEGKADSLVATSQKRI